MTKGGPGHALFLAGLGRNDHAGRSRDTFGKAQLDFYTFREHPPSGAEHQRVDHQQVLVDQVGASGN